MKPRSGTGRRGLTAITFFTAAAAASWLMAAGQTTQLRLVSTIWPPFTNNSGQPRFALDLVEEGTRRIGVTTTTAFVEAAKFTPALLTGAFDGSAAAWKDAERERVLLFSQPYLENRLILVARRGGDVSAKALAELKGKRIAIVEGYAYGDTIDTAGPTFVRSRGEEDSLALLLRMQGAEVRCAYSGREGIDQAVSWKAHVALIDIGLPDMAGYEVAQRIREQRGSRTLLLAVTGFNDPKSMSQAGEAGFAEWLVKPIELRELHALVLRHLETSQSGTKKTRE